MSQWTHILTKSEIDAHHALTASIDPSFARKQREFYESRTPSDLQVLKHEAWLCCTPDTYQLAASYLALHNA